MSLGPLPIDIDFWDIGKERGHIILFYTVFQFVWGLHQNVAFLGYQEVVSKIQIVNIRRVTRLSQVALMTGKSFIR